jgi:hypothetical protein
MTLIHWITPEHGYTSCGRYKVQSLGEQFYLLTDHAGRSRRLFTVYAVHSVIDLGALPSLCDNPPGEALELA